MYWHGACTYCLHPNRIFEPAVITQMHTEDREPTMADRKRAVRILARSIFKELTQQGYTEQQIVSLATELISEVTHKISRAPATD